MMSRESERAARAPRLSTQELMTRVLDPGSFRSWDRAQAYPRADDAYAAELRAAREQSGADEAILTGEARIGGFRVAVVLSEFAFLAGTLGSVAAWRVVRACERATRERLPLLLSPASGGTRMQEGTRAFTAMVKMAAACANHQAAGLLSLVYLRHPSTGGALASFGSLGQITVGEPGALIGFLGPRVYASLTGEPFPAGVQTAENLAGHGVIDGVLRPDELRDMVTRTLRLLRATEQELEQKQKLNTGTKAARGSTDAWASIVRTRDPNRPGLRELLRYAATEVVRLSGTGQGERDPGLALCLARLGRTPAVVVGQDRRIQRSRAALGPGALRAARRAMRLALDLRLPLVTVIDTPGAALSPEAEEGGLASEIARCLADLMTHEGVTLSVLLGEGTGGGALALLPADRTLSAEHAWLSPLPPEGAAAIVHRDPGRAAEVAQHQGVSSGELLTHGIVDHIVPELPDAAEEPQAFCERLGASITRELRDLTRAGPAGRLAARAARYRELG